MATTIKTKFKIGDEIWYISNNQIGHQKVTGVSIRIEPQSDTDITSDKTIITYTINYGTNTIEESRAFSSAKNLKSSLTNPDFVEPDSDNGISKSFDISFGDNVWFMHNDKPQDGKVSKVFYTKFIDTFSIDKTTISEHYYIRLEGDDKDLSDYYTTDKLFDSECELLDKLFEQYIPKESGE